MNEEVEVQLDTLVEGLIGFRVGVKATGRVFRVSRWGWIGVYDEENQKQHIMYPGRFLVRGEPRPEAKRGSTPEYLRRG